MVTALAASVDGRDTDASADDEAKVEDTLGRVGDEHAHHMIPLDTDLESHEEAMSRPDADMWKAACTEELLAFAKAELYDEVEKPHDRKVVGCKWVFNVKHGPDGTIEWYKARLIAKGFTQVEGIHYSETFAPVSKFASICTLLALAAVFNLKVDQMDIKSAFLNGNLSEEIFMTAPSGSSYCDGHVWHLKKSLYGLKQASREWYKKIHTKFESLGFRRSNADHSIFTKFEGHPPCHCTVHQ